MLYGNINIFGKSKNMLDKITNIFYTNMNTFIESKSLPHLYHISAIHFNKINWPPIEHRVELYTAITIFKFWNQLTPSYFEGIFIPSFNKYSTRSQMALDIPLRKITIGQKSI